MRYIALVVIAPVKTQFNPSINKIANIEKMNTKWKEKKKKYKKRNKIKNNIERQTVVLKPGYSHKVQILRI